MAYTGRLRPKGVPFLGFSYMHFMAGKTESWKKSIKCSGVVVYSYFKVQCIELDMSKGYHMSIEGTRKEYLYWYIKE